MKWYYVWWPWLTSKRVARVCQHQLSFLLTQVFYPWRYETCRVIQQQFWMKQCDILRPLLHIFRGQDPPTPMIYTPTPYLLRDRRRWNNGRLNKTQTCVRVRSRESYQRRTTSANCRWQTARIFCVATRRDRSNDGLCRRSRWNSHSDLLVCCVCVSAVCAFDVFCWGHDKMRICAVLRGGSPLVSFDHVIELHFVTFSSSLYRTIRKPNHILYVMWWGCHLTRILKNPP